MSWQTSSRQATLSEYTVLGKFKKLNLAVPFEFGRIQSTLQEAVVEEKGALLSAQAESGLPLLACLVQSEPWLARSSNNEDSG